MPVEERSSWTVGIRLLIMELLNLFLQRRTTWFRQTSIRATWKSNTNDQMLERNCIGNKYSVRKNSVYKKSRLNFLTVCFMLASHPRKVNRLNSQLNSDQRRTCACAAWGFRAEPKRGFELVVPRRLSLQWHLILRDLSSKRERTKPYNKILPLNWKPCLHSRVERTKRRKARCESCFLSLWGVK